MKIVSMKTLSREADLIFFKFTTERIVKPDI